MTIHCVHPTSTSCDDSAQAYSTLLSLVFSIVCVVWKMKP